VKRDQLRRRRERRWSRHRRQRWRELQLARVVTWGKGREGPKLEESSISPAFPHCGSHTACCSSGPGKPRERRTSALARSRGGSTTEPMFPPIPIAHAPPRARRPCPRAPPHQAHRLPSEASAAKGAEPGWQRRRRAARGRGGRQRPRPGAATAAPGAPPSRQRAPSPASWPAWSGRTGVR